MCIRDSPRSDEVNTMAAEHGISADGVAEVGVAPVQNHIIPVSYTHLRAHETVLDLVCRLLLEKKKNTTTITE